MQILSKVLYSNSTGITIDNGGMYVIKMPDTLDLVNLFMIILNKSNQLYLQIIYQIHNSFECIQCIPDGLLHI